MQYIYSTYFHRDVAHIAGKLAYRHNYQGNVAVGQTISTTHRRVHLPVVCESIRNVHAVVTPTLSLISISSSSFPYFGHVITCSSNRFFSIVALHSPLVPLSLRLFSKRQESTRVTQTVTCTQHGKETQEGDVGRVKLHPTLVYAPNV